MVRDSPRAMKAVVIDRPGNASVLSLREVPEPPLGPGLVRVRVRATALNRADLLQRRGLYPAPPGVPADVPGLEFAGDVDALGPGVTQWKRGDRVMGLVAGGAYAEFVVVPERMLLRVPEHLSDPQAAALPEAFLTAFDALEQGGFVPGAHVLVHAVGSGVGVAVVQLVNALGGTCYGTTRSAQKLARARELGLSHGTSDADFAPALSALRPEGFDVVVDLVGGGITGRSLPLLAERGCLVLVGLMGGASAEFDLGLLLRRRLRVVGTVLRSRPLEEKLALTQRFARQGLPLFEKRKLEPVLDRVLPLEACQQAHLAMEANENFGKIVLTV